MKWLVVVISVFCFSALANVVCKDPSSQGDEGTEAQDVIANCRPSATGSAGGAVDRGGTSENPQATLANLSDGVVPAAPSGGGGTTDAQTGAETGSATGTAEDDSGVADSGSTSGDGGSQQ